MQTDRELVELTRFETGPYRCPYLPLQMARLEYRIVADLPANAYQELLCRGWRRFGQEYFRPVCPQCTACQSLRVKVDQFQPSRSQRRTLTRNAHIEVVVRSPTVTERHVQLYNAYHADMHHRRGWPLETISAGEYRRTFLAGDTGFAREFLFWDRGELAGVALADVVPEAISSVYFFHDPRWRSSGPGVFSILQQQRYAAEQGLRYQYLGYCVSQCQSMSYKSRYQPHEVLAGYPADQAAPVWTAPHHEKSRATSAEN